jgi:flavin-dependent dehydrogenase
LAAQWSVEEAGRSRDAALTPGTIYMAVDRAGYVGLVITEGGRVNLAAAVDRGAVQGSSPAAVCDQITSSCGWDLSEPLHRVRFLGTAAMTRRRRIAGDHRLLFVGDSSGYVEPFTGEGMAWAAASALAAGSLADQAINHWHESCPLIWTNNLKMLLGGRQRRCRWISRLLRYPAAARCAIAALSAFPTLGQFAVQSVQQESSSDLLHRCAGDRGTDAGGRAA